MGMWKNGDSGTTGMSTHGGSDGKNLPIIRETQARSLGLSGRFLGAGTG